MKQGRTPRARWSSTAAVLALLVAGSARGTTKVDLNGGVYPAFRWDELGTTFMMMSAEADISARYSSRTRDIATGVLQLWATLPMRDQSMDFHFGEAYVTVPLGLRRPVLKAGQAVIPFGLLADYDTHAQVIQPPYARTLGIRIDPGAGFQGQLGRTDYAFWVSNGSGPYWTDFDRNKVVTARIAPRFLLGDAELTLGLSALAGSLPCYHLDSVPSMDAGPYIYRMRQPMGMDTGGNTTMENTYRMKYRLAVDNTTDWGHATLHLEGVVGKDLTLSGPLVYSYYLEGRYAVTDWLEPIVRYDAVHVDGQGTHRVADAGLTLSYPNLSSVYLQTVFQREWMDLVGIRRRFWNLTAQLTYRF